MLPNATPASHTHTQLAHTQLGLAGVALGDIDLLGFLWWCAWVPVGAVDAAVVCVRGRARVRAGGRAGVGVGVGVAGVAGVALGSRRGTWKQAWHSATSTFMLCGGHGTYRTSYVHPPPSSKLTRTFSNA